MKMSDVIADFIGEMLSKASQTDFPAYRVRSIM